MKKIVLFFLVLFEMNIFAQKPKADFDVVVTYNCYYATTKYLNKSEGAVRYYWKSDGMENFYECYEPHGSNISGSVNFTTTLIAISSDGQSDTIEKNINIAPTTLKIKYAPVDLSLFAPATIQFINDSYIRPGDESLSYKWTFDNGIETTDTNPVYTFQNPGAYNIMLTGKTSTCEKNAYETIVVKDSAQRGEFSFIKSGCSQNNYIIPPCGSGKHYQVLNDTLKISGTYSGNCGATKTATIRYRGDTILIRSWETGPLTTCGCEFCFEINIPHYSNDSAIIYFNGERIKHTITSLQQINLLEKLVNVYPNPFTDKLSLEINDYLLLPLHISISDVGGRKIYENTLFENSNQIQLEKKGIYLLHIYSSKGAITKKIIKL